MPGKLDINNASTEETTVMMMQSTRSTTGISSSSSTSSSAFSLSKSEIEDLREAFRLFDADGKGVISFPELKEVADALALENGNKENAMSTHSFRHLSDLLCGVKDVGEDVELDEDAFIRLLSERHQDDNRDEYQRVFDLFDTKGKGHIDIRDLRQIAEMLGESMSDEELMEMIEKAAPTTGRVTPEDFQKIMTKRLFS